MIIITKEKTGAKEIRTSMRLNLRFFKLIQLFKIRHIIKIVVGTKLIRKK